jgi:hypothetical protein
VAKLTGKLVKILVKDWGADLAGIAPVARFEGAPAGHGPLDLMPQAKSVIVAGVRIPDPVVDYDEYHLKMTEMKPEQGIQANIENFYMLMGHYVEDMMLNIIATRLANYIEINHRRRSLPTPNAQHTGLGHPVMAASMGFFSQRHAAVRAGLGEFGLNGLVVTPQYGRVRHHRGGAGAGPAFNGKGMPAGKMRGRGGARMPAEMRQQSPDTAAGRRLRKDIHRYTGQPGAVQVHQYVHHRGGLRVHLHRYLHEGLPGGAQGD